MRFRKATWGDFFAAFAGAGGQDLEGFAQQWLTRTGAPLLTLESATLEDGKVALGIGQTDPPFDLRIPVIFQTPDGPVEESVHLDGYYGSFVFEVPAATSVAVDPDFHVFRRLHPEEVEPTIRQILSEEFPYFVLPRGTEAEVEAARKFALGFAETDTPQLLMEGEMPLDMQPGSGSSTVLINPPVSFLKEHAPEGLTLSGDLFFLEGRRFSLKEHDLVFAFGSSFDPTRSDLAIISRDPVRLSSLARRIGHYGKYSWLVFPARRGETVKGNWPPAGSPLSARIGG
jgi:hypothetical protein